MPGYATTPGQQVLTGTQLFNGQRQAAVLQLPRPNTTALLGSTMLPISALMDNFTDNLDKDFKWSWSSLEAVRVAGRVRIPCTTSYFQLASEPKYSLVGSSIYARMYPATGGTGTRETMMQVMLDSNNYVDILVSGTDLIARRVVAGTPTTVATATYNADTHAWWRIREDAGTVYFDYSYNGVVWANLGSTTVSWSLALVQAVFASGYYGTESAADTYIDSVNVLGASVPTFPTNSGTSSEFAEAGTSWTVNFGFTATAKRLLVLTTSVRATDPAAAINTPADWTSAINQLEGGGVSPRLQVFFRVAAGGETSVALTKNTTLGYYGAIIEEFDIGGRTPSLNVTATAHPSGADVTALKATSAATANQVLALTAISLREGTASSALTLGGEPWRQNTPFRVPAPSTLLMSTGAAQVTPGEVLESAWTWSTANRGVAAIATLNLSTTLGRPKAWTGSLWPFRPLRYWSGSAWLEKPIKYWTGTEWRVLNSPLMSFNTLTYSADTGASSQTRTTSSFTPTANSLLVVVANCIRGNHTTAYSFQSPSGGGLTYTQRVTPFGVDPTGFGTNFRQEMCVWTAPVGASPSSMTVTVDAFSGTDLAYYSVLVFEVLDCNLTSPLFQAVVTDNVNPGATDAQAQTLTLGSNPTLKNGVVALFCPLVNTGSTPSTPSGFTVINTTLAPGTTVSAYGNTNTEDPVITTPDLGQQVVSSLAVAMELALA